MTSEIIEALHSLQGFSSLGEAALQQVASFASIRTVRAGETVFCQGEPSPYCFGILAGEIVIQHVSKDARFPPKVLGVLGPGSLFGESSIFEEGARRAMASAAKDGRLIAVRGTQLRGWIQANPAIAQPFIMNLLQSSIGRLQHTSQELAVVYGIGRLLGQDRPFFDQMAATLEFLKSSFKGLDDVVFYQRSAFWDEYNAILSFPVLQDLAPIPLQNEWVQKASIAGVAQVFTPKAVKTHLAAFKLPWDGRASVALLPLFDWDKAKDPLQGLLLLASQEDEQAFGPQKQLLLTSLSHPLAEALSRHARQEDALAKARLNNAKNSLPE